MEKISKNFLLQNPYISRLFAICAIRAIKKTVGIFGTANGTACLSNCKAT